ncbi:MAG: chorismate-binding protein, partial [Candidatus Marinimicrobia bacterium]|nr:chorismate-binding protein [Candidatus Neomarinimicrobiota bacterium]
MAGLITSTIRIPDLHQLPELFPQHLADLRERLHRGDKSTKPTIIKIKFEPNDGKPVDQLAWLTSQTALPKIAWYARDGAYSVAALGSAHERYATQVNSPAELQTVLNGLTNHDSEYLSYFGGVAFDPYVETDLEWRPFGAYRFVAPMFYFETEAGRQRFVVQAIAPDKIAPALEGLTDAFQAIRWDNAPPETPMIQLLSRDEFPAHDRWLEIHAQVLNDIGNAKYQKVVLAKNEVLNTAANLTPGSIFHQLVQSNSSSYRFYFEPEPNRVFMGASPERLFRREQNTLQSEALAATRSRGKSPAETEELGQELMNSGKDRLEHQIVFEQ